MEDYPNSVTKKCHETISKQMNNSFVIFNEKENRNIYSYKL